eukprot:1217472-Amphidinium_carterae.1
MHSLTNARRACGTASQKLGRPTRELCCLIDSLIFDYCTCQVVWDRLGDYDHLQRVFTLEVAVVLSAMGEFQFTRPLLRAALELGADQKVRRALHAPSSISTHFPWRGTFIEPCCPRHGTCQLPHCATWCNGHRTSTLLP